MSPLSKRLFGRFLTNFLQPEHFRRIAKCRAAVYGLRARFRELQL